MHRALLLALLLIPLCAFTQDGEDGEPEFRRVYKPKDTTDEIIKTYTEGKVLGPWRVSLHEDPKAGQYWEVHSNSYDIDTTVRWQITKVEDGVALVEKRTTVSSEMFKSDYVLAWRVTLKPAEGKQPLTRAWVGKPGADPAQFEMKGLEDPKPEAADDRKGEDFKDLELAGAKWKGKVYKLEDDELTIRIWEAEGGWFDKIVKTTVDEDYEEKLQAYGSDGKGIMKWPDDILKPAQDKQN